MPQIIPIRDLKNTSEISQRCHAANEPIFITKNGYGDMVIMSMEMYEEKMFMLDVYSKLIAAEKQLTEGKVLDGDASLQSLIDLVRDGKPITEETIREYRVKLNKAVDELVVQAEQEYSKKEYVSLAKLKRENENV